MPTIKAYSVARTQGGAMSAGNVSTVYSYSGNPAGQAHCGRNGAYDHPDGGSQLQQGRQPTNMRGLKAANNHDATGASARVAGTGPEEVKNKKVVCTTTTKTGSGAGLIVEFTATNTSPPTLPAAGNIAVYETDATRFGGENYASGDKVTVDGFPGSELTISVS